MRSSFEIISLEKILCTHFVDCCESSGFSTKLWTKDSSNTLIQWSYYYKMHSCSLFGFWKFQSCQGRQNTTFFRKMFYMQWPLLASHTCWVTSLTCIVNPAEDSFSVPLPYNRNANVALKYFVSMNLQYVYLLYGTVQCCSGNNKILKKNAQYVHLVWLAVEHVPIHRESWSHLRECWKEGLEI